MLFAFYYYHRHRAFDLVVLSLFSLVFWICDFKLNPLQSRAPLHFYFFILCIILAIAFNFHPYSLLCISLQGPPLVCPAPALYAHLLGRLTYLNIWGWWQSSFPSGVVKDCWQEKILGLLNTPSCIRLFIRTERWGKKAASKYISP